MDRFVICMKWGTKYGPEYVNRLYGMVSRHLRGPFRFVCFTDDVSGIRAEVENFPLPELALQASKLDGGWRKLNSYQADLYGLQGEAMFLDLDVVIVDDITPLFEFPGEFPIIKDWKRPWRVTGNSSVYRFRLGAHVDVLEYFLANQSSVRAKHRNEQEYLSHYIHDQGKLVYWPAEWCCSFKYQCLPPWPMTFWQMAKIPKGCRIVVFHGEVNPPDAIAGRRNRAGSGMVPVSWVAEHWRE
jgi:hypothetical protein